MAEAIFYPPKRGEPFRVSIVLNDLYRKWPERVMSLFERRAFDYAKFHGTPLTYTTWQRHPLRVVPGI